MKIPKKPTQRDDELIVLASMIAPETAKEASKIIIKAGLRPSIMFVDAEMRDNYEIFKKYGAEQFDCAGTAYLCQTPVKDLATPYVAPYVQRIVNAYKRALQKTDRTLDSFETPGPDTEDPDCLFQNRWLRKGACGAIVSTSGVGKSSFCMQAAALWAGGEECLGIRPLRPLKIGVFQSEDDEYDVANFRDRIRVGLSQIAGWTGEKIRMAERNVTFCALDGSSGERFIDYLRQKQALHAFDLLIINPLFAFFGGDANDGDAMTSFLRHGIDPLIKGEGTKCGCLIVHHTGKPNRDAMKRGDIFTAYLGSGSSEFTNYIRSAVVFTPWTSDKDGQKFTPGVFRMIAAKHGDKLAWRGSDGKATTEKVVCYANRLAEYANSGMIYWVEPDEVQFAAIKKEANATTSAAAAPPVDPNERCAQILAEHIRTAWTATMRPPDGGDGQREWVQRVKVQGYRFSRATRANVYDAMLRVTPGRWGLTLFATGKGKGYLIGTDVAAAPDFDDMEQEEML